MGAAKGRGTLAERIQQAQAREIATVEALAAEPEKPMRRLSAKEMRASMVAGLLLGIAGSSLANSQSRRGWKR